MNLITNFIIFCCSKPSSVLKFMLKLIKFLKILGKICSKKQSITDGLLATQADNMKSVNSIPALQHVELANTVRPVDFTIMATFEQLILVKHYFSARNLLLHIFNISVMLMQSSKLIQQVLHEELFSACMHNLEAQ